VTRRNIFQRALAAPLALLGLRGAGGVVPVSIGHEATSLGDGSYAVGRLISMTPVDTGPREWAYLLGNKNKVYLDELYGRRPEPLPGPNEPFGVFAMDTSQVA
jgi:hypothetical protein